MAADGRRFEILHPLGTGGFGAVYKAKILDERHGFEKVVALKILHDNMAGVDDVAKRLRDEARVLGLLRHRVIVQADELIRLDEGRWGIVMELVDGVDLKRVLRSGGPIPPSVVLEIVSEVASALHSAYQTRAPGGGTLGLVHRDIKPSNIQITAHGETKLLDFGIARAEFDNREADTVNKAYGSMAYMAPERFDMVDGPQGDIYALGATMYELMTGEQFGRTSPNEDRHYEHVGDRLESLCEALEDPAPLVTLISSTFEFEPGSRPMARILERQCARLRQLIAGPRLRDWAEQAVPAARQQQSDRSNDGVQDNLTGTILTEIADKGGSTSSHGSAEENWNWAREPTPSNDPRVEHPPGRASPPTTETRASDPKEDTVLLTVWVLTVTFMLFALAMTVLAVGAQLLL